MLSLRPEEPREPGPCLRARRRRRPAPSARVPAAPLLSANIPEIKRYVAAAAGPGAGGAGERGEAAPAAAMEALGPGERAQAGPA